MKRKALALFLSIAMLIQPVEGAQVYAAQADSYTTEIESEEDANEVDVTDETSLITVADTETNSEAVQEQVPEAVDEIVQDETVSDDPTAEDTDCEEEANEETVVEEALFEDGELLVEEVSAKDSGIIQAASFAIYEPIREKKLTVHIYDDSVELVSDYAGASAAILSALKNKTEEIDISKYNILKTDIRALVAQVVNANQELYYVSGQYKFTYDKAGRVRTLYMNYTESTPGGSRTLESAIAEALSFTNSSMTKLGKALALHDYLALNVAYHTEAGYPSFVFTAEGALVKQDAVCQGYALAYELLLERAGFAEDEVITIASDDMDHAWNMVKLNNSWYHVDVTWDDALINGKDCPGWLRHDFFMLSDQTIRDDQHEHYGWYSGGIYADSVLYDKYFWTELETGVFYYAGQWFYCYNHGIYACNDIFYISGSYPKKSTMPANGYTVDGFNMLNGQLYCSNSTNVYEVKPDGTLKSIAELDAQQGETWSIEGLIVKQNKLYCVLRKSYYGAYYELEEVDLGTTDEEELSNITFDKTELTLSYGETGVLTPVLTPAKPSNAETTDFIWKSSNTAIATVEDGLVTPIKEGTCQISYEYTQNPSIKAVCTINVKAVEYTVTFLDQDGKEISTQKVKRGDAAVLPTAPTIDGYVFDKWEGDGDCEFVTSDMTVKAAYELITYYITYVLNDGDISQDDIIVSYTRANENFYLPIPSKEGMVFEGWYTDEALTKPISFVDTSWVKDLTIYAKWRQMTEQEMWGNITEEDRKDFTPQTVPSGFWVKGFVNETEYTGAAITFPELRVYRGKVLLNGKTDYTVSYKNNKVVGTATITIKGKGNYSGTLVKTFRIVPRVLDNPENTDSLRVADLVLPANGKEQKPVPTVYWKNLKLKAGVDYTVAYPETGSTAYVAPSSTGYKIRVTGAGNFATKKPIEVKLFLLGENMTSVNKLKVTGIKALPYTGSKVYQTDMAVALDANTVLKENTDYTLEYRSNIEIGTAYIILTGTGKTGGYFGQRILNFKITKPVLSKVAPVDMTDSTEPFTYTYEKKIEFVKGGVKPSIEVSYKGQKLAEGTDYTVAYKNNKVYYDTSVDSSLNAKISGSTPLDGKEPVIVVKGKGKYKGSVSKAFAITKKDFAYSKVEAKGVVYKDKAGNWKSAVAVKDALGQTLSAGTDYEKTVKYVYENATVVKNGTNTAVQRRRGDEADAKDIAPAGTVMKAIVTGKGSYTTKDIFTYYTIAEYDIAKAKVSLEKSEYIYTGEPITPGRDEISLVVDGVPSDNYVITGYSNNVKKGTAKMTIVGTNNLGGTRTISYKIIDKSMNYTISFSGNGGLGAMKTINLLLDETPIPANVFKRDGYNFTGWNSKKDGKGVSFKDQGTVKKGEDGDVLVLYAQWKPIVYTITYNMNGGNNNINNPKTYTIEDEVTLLNGTITGKFKQEGWYTDAACTKAITGIKRGTMGNLTLYAEWIEDFDVYPLDVNSHTLAEVKAFVSSHPTSSTDSYEIRPSTSKPYAAGRLSASTMTSCTNAINNIRYMAGLDPVVKEDSTLSYYASAGTLLNYLNNTLSHTPRVPSGMTKDDPLYKDGYKGASSSNIAWTSWSASMRYAINLWMEDSDSSNIDRVGHRRWILNPRMGKIGFGRTEGYYAMYAFDTSNSKPTATQSAWPAQNTSLSYYTSGSAWSVSLNKSLAEGTGDVKIVVTDLSTGKKWKGKPLYVNNGGYGTPGCIIFKPGVSTGAGKRYKVSVFLYKLEHEIQYEVGFY